MASIEAIEQKVRRVKSQRKLFITISICTIASIGLSVPRKVANYRQLKAVNDRLVELQGDIVYTQQQIRLVEDELLAAQREIRKQEAQ
jgi:uncharacterized protein YbbK (DUF523 family)